MSAVGGTIMTGAVIAGLFLAQPDILPVLVIMIALIGMIGTALIAFAICFAAVARWRQPQQPREACGGEGCDDDGTGNCTGCRPVAVDDMLRVVAPTDDDIEQMIRDWNKGSR